MSHATLILCYHAFMLVLHASLNMTCTLVATFMILLGNLECIEITNASVICLHFCMQEEDGNGKCHFCTP